MIIDGDATAAATSAVAALGAAVAARAAETGRLDPAGAATARRLADDMEFLQSVPAYAGRHAELTRSYDQALDAIWAPGSPDRPVEPVEAIERCEAISAALAAPGADAAARLSKVPPGDGFARVMADGRQVNLLGKRLAEAGIDPAEPDATPIGKVAMALCDLAAAHGSIPVTDLGVEAEAASALATALADASAPIQAVVRLSGRPGLPCDDAARIADALAAMPFQWCPSLDPATDVAALAAAMVAEASALAAAVAGADALDAAHGEAWRHDEPSKIGAAARILSTPDDPRRDRARPYALGLGLAGSDEDIGATLWAMAAATVAIRRHSGRPALGEALGALPPGTLEGDCVEGLRTAAEWRSAYAATETQSRFVRALASEPGPSRDALLASLPALARALGAIPAARRREPVATLCRKIRDEAASLATHASILASRGEDELKPARRAARHIRDLAAALSRMASEPDFLSVEGGMTPMDAAGAIEWMDAHIDVMPPGMLDSGRLDPTLAGEVGNAAAASRELADLRGEAERRTGESSPQTLLAGARAALTEIRLRECREAVERSMAWGYVARLEGEGIPAASWREAMDAWPEEEAGGTDVHVEEPAPPPVADSSLWWRRIAIVSGGPEPRPV